MMQLQEADAAMRPKLAYRLPAGHARNCGVALRRY
jgi:hypothetical protein